MIHCQKHVSDLNLFILPQCCMLSKSLYTLTPSARCDRLGKQAGRWLFNLLVVKYYSNVVALRCICILFVWILMIRFQSATISPPPVYELTVDVRYRDGGTRASRFFSKHSPESITQLKQDLEQLRFPTPQESNLTFVSAGCMKAFWIASLNSVRILIGVDLLFRKHGSHVQMHTYCSHCTND
jgi:hypothetical protein